MEIQTPAPVHVLLCFNALYQQHAAVCLTSLLENNPDLGFNVVVVQRATEILDQDRLRRSLTQFPNHSLCFRQFVAPANLPLNPLAHYTLDNWTRLWVQDFFGSEVNRVLYLDSDIVVTGSVKPLWSTDLDGALLGAVDIPGSQRGIDHLGMGSDDGYFNSGVLLIDLKQWREIDALSKILSYIGTSQHNLEDLDQDALNVCFHSQRKRLDYKWNVTWSFFQDKEPLPLTPTQVDAVRRNAILIHFNGASKPWSYWCRHPRKPDYERYLRMTEWRDFVPSDRTVVNRIHKAIATVLPGKLKSGLKTLAEFSFSTHLVQRSTH